ncbi:hypothetical protein SBOR_6844 [Sclerotinia borealis F-4128]|uniref:Protein kinase domain-containing protein n=1 Tax=Sclerotinia borealis (strain F-4128) TaxID=1432307 RepID=W9C7R1_SCLBF|nr:hypothetical protein SBOR_6844 [Sclerotinia borealis F-4128]
MSVLRIVNTPLSLYSHQFSSIFTTFNQPEQRLFNEQIKEILRTFSFTAVQESVRARKRRRQLYASWLKYFNGYEAELIEAGVFAIVLAVNEELAVKPIASGPKHERDYEREVEIHQKLNTKGYSPKIVRFFEVLWGCGIVMERLSMTRRQPLRSPVDGTYLKDKWMMGIATGSKSLHTQGVLHENWAPIPLCQSNFHEFAKP